MKSYTSVVLLPFRYNNFTASYNYSVYKNAVMAERNKTLNKGGSRVAKVSINRVVHRDSKSKTQVNLGFGYDEYSNYVGVTKIGLSTYKVRKFDIGFNHQHRLDSSVVGFGAQYTGGMRLNYWANFSKFFMPDKKFNKLNANFSWYKPLPVQVNNKQLSYNFQASGQVSPDSLVISEKDTVGGLASVRGFKDYSENSDNSFTVRNELSLDISSFKPPRIKALLGDISIFGAFDWGVFKNRGEKSGFLSGIAGGIRNRSGHINFGLTIAKPLEAEALLKKDVVVYFNFSVEV
jgi:hemolysin activation/secretion protein